MLKILINPPTIINGTPENPDFSGLPTEVIPVIQAAIEAGEYEIIPDPEPPPEPPNILGLRDEICYGDRYPLVQDWYDTLPPRKRDPLQIAISSQDLGAIQEALAPITPTDKAVLAKFAALFAEFNIPLLLS